MLAISEVVISKSLGEVEHYSSLRSILSIHCDTIRGACICSESHLAAPIYVSEAEYASRIIVLNDANDRVELIPCVHSQQRVDKASICIEFYVTTEIRRPRIPQRMAACVARMVRLARFLGGYTV